MAKKDSIQDEIKSFSTSNFRYRKTYGKIPRIVDIPNLIEMQKESYHRFLQAEIAPDRRQDIGLQGVFKSVFPIRDFNETASLEFVQYVLEEPKYDVNECRARGMTYAAPLKVTVRLVLWELDEDGKPLNIRDVKEQEVYFGEIPLMTRNGTFVINGTERVVVSQLHRSPGVFFDRDKAKNVGATGRANFTARVIPYRGSWLDFEFDSKDIMYVRIDRRRKFPATILLRALGMAEEQIINYFYQNEIFSLDGKKITKNVVPDVLSGQVVNFDIKDKAGNVIIKAGRRFTKFAVKNLEKNNIDEIPVKDDELVGRIAATNIVDPATGEILIEVNQQLTEDHLTKIFEAKIKELKLIYINNQTVSGSLRDTLLGDKIESPEEAMMEIYKKLRPGDPPTIESARYFFKGLFFDAEKYDLAQVGRLKMNHKFRLNTPLEERVLTKDDILGTLRYLLGLKVAKGDIDDIDHLGNRRVRSVSELLENQYRVGLVRMERAIKERLSLQELETLMPHELINAKPVSAVVKEFFGTSQLSQFMDQTNPLSEITHKRRLSALGPGGLTRDRAGFEVRDVHPTHYGRICPIETPEGPNIGLIASLSTYARINEFGFIETPYRKVVDGRVTDEVIYASALEEQDKIIAQANVKVDEKGRMTEELVSARRSGEFVLIPPAEVNLIDVSPSQIVSVAASLVPFLEHDDANRALMGSNMQRQAVPLIRSSAPVVGTGMEKVVAKDSGVTVVAQHTGWIESVDSSRIVLRVDTDAPDYKKTETGTGVEIYSLLKYMRSNQNTCINQTPIVKAGQYVRAGEILADGPATELGELALGQNVTVAFMSWGGYNFEDSILISEKAVREDYFTSIHIEEFEVLARDTKLGMEEITRDIPNVGDDALASLDDSGIIRIGAKVRPGDILVGKVTPKGETQLSPEEKLLRAIFGEKASDVKDTSLRVPPGVVGTIINTRVFQREGVEKDSRAKLIEDYEAKRILQDQEDEVRIIRESGLRTIRAHLVGQTVNGPVSGRDGNPVLKKGEKISEDVLNQVSENDWSRIPLSNESKENEIRQVYESISNQIEAIKILAQTKIEKLSRGDELPPGVIKMVKVYIAIKRKIEVGDKMAGRHGNKGVISRVLPEEDLPYLADGTPVDIILNPLGVPSRMNVGQMLETHLGGAATGIGKVINQMLEKNAEIDRLRDYLARVYPAESVQKFVKAASREELVEFAKKLKTGVTLAVPVFDGIDEKEIANMFDLANLPNDGQVYLFDGRTGETFERRVTVGTIYILKLHHIAEDKIHARSIGPYSIVTQQPLGGKAQFGGQRLGEMEVWAMEAYGAAHALQEFLTVKSDDIIGRTRMYESIVKGEYNLEPGLPESFNVLTKELRALGLNVQLVQDMPTDGSAGHGA
ncbi:MAG: DNA-directed RNA polymerase subunit beta [Deltaproteobacteria bacterium]|nr:DNA-directed RNA polymerase subunit beta [Deltaproteobacteria bacterium]